MRYLDKEGNMFSTPVGAFTSDIKAIYSETVWNLHCYYVISTITSSVMHALKSKSMRRNSNEVL